MSQPEGVLPQPAVLVSREGAIATVVLNRPHKLNALDQAAVDGSW